MTALRHVTWESFVKLGYLPLAG